MDKGSKDATDLRVQSGIPTGISTAAAYLGALEALLRAAEDPRFLL